MLVLDTWHICNLKCRCCIVNIFCCLWYVSCVYVCLSLAFWCCALCRLCHLVCFFSLSKLILTLGTSVLYIYFELPCCFLLLPKALNLHESAMHDASMWKLSDVISLESELLGLFTSWSCGWKIEFVFLFQFMFSSVLFKRLPAESGISVLCASSGIVQTNVVSILKLTIVHLFLDGLSFSWI
jgi:hypothetical protein